MFPKPKPELLFLVLKIVVVVFFVAFLEYLFMSVLQLRVAVRNLQAVPTPAPTVVVVPTETATPSATVVPLRGSSAGPFIRSIGGKTVTPTTGAMSR